MKILERFWFRQPKRASASIAKERLQIIVSHESSQEGGPELVKRLQSEILEVLQRYVKIDPDKIRVQLDKTGDHSVLELNVTLSEGLC